MFIWSSASLIRTAHAAGIEGQQQATERKAYADTVRTTYTYISAGKAEAVYGDHRMSLPGNAAMQDDEFIQPSRRRAEVPLPAADRKIEDVIEREVLGRDSGISLVLFPDVQAVPFVPGLNAWGRAGRGDDGADHAAAAAGDTHSDVRTLY